MLAAAKEWGARLLYALFYGNYRTLLSNVFHTNKWHCSMPYLFRRIARNY